MNNYLQHFNNKMNVTASGVSSSVTKVSVKMIFWKTIHVFDLPHFASCYEKDV